MKTWALMTGGLIVWAIHFIGVYLISSIADLLVEADDARWRMAGLAFSLACVVVICGLLAAAVHRLRASPRFSDQLAALGAGTALIAVLWQSLPQIVGF